MNQNSCSKVKNPCKICLNQVTNKTGLQCMGACKKWAHYKCLNYTPGKISDIKAGIIKVMCPCPNCDTSAPKEILTNPPYTCSNHQCPANKLPICQSKDCPMVLSQRVSVVSDCPPTCPVVKESRNPSAPKPTCPPPQPKQDVKRPCNLPPEYMDSDSSQELNSPKPCPPACPLAKPKPPPCPPACPSNESKHQQSCPPPRPTCPPPQTCPPTPRPPACPPACPSNEALPPRPRPQQTSSRCPSTCKPPRMPTRLKPNQPCPPSCKAQNQQGGPPMHYSKNRNVPVIRESAAVPNRPCNEPVQEPPPPPPPLSCPKPPAPCQPQPPQPKKHSCPPPCFLPKVSNNYSAYDIASPAKSPSCSFQSNESTGSQRCVDCIVSSSDSQVTRNKYDPMMSTLEDMCNTMTNLTVQMKDLMAKMVAM